MADFQEPKPHSKKPENYRYEIQHSLNQLPARHRALGEVYEWVESCVLAVVCILLLFTCLARTATVSGPSMMPTLQNGDQLLLLQAGYHQPQHGDIIVIDRTQSDEPPIIKRVIGCAGDEIDIDFSSHEVRRNGELLKEDYINEPTALSYDVTFPVTVPDGAVFVLGDNRNHSMDSRAGEIGMVDLRRVMGKAVFRFIPLDQFGPTE